MKNVAVVTWSICAGLLLAGSAYAQPTIATIDLKKVFDGYYKTKLADAQLKERGADMQKVYAGMVDDFKKAQTDYNQLMENVNDQAVSNDEREKRKKLAETKLKELQEIQQSLAQFDQQSRTTIAEQRQRMREGILREIREVIDAKAKTAGYTLLVDSAAESVNQTPVLLYSSGQNDITEEILTKLNATAPAALGKPQEPDKPAERKEEKKP